MLQMARKTHGKTDKFFWMVFPFSSMISRFVPGTTKSMMNHRFTLSYFPPKLGQARTSAWGIDLTSPHPATPTAIQGRSVYTRPCRASKQMHASMALAVACWTSSNKSVPNDISSGWLPAGGPGRGAVQSALPAGLKIALLNRDDSASKTDNSIWPFPGWIPGHSINLSPAMLTNSHQWRSYKSEERLL